MNIMIKYVLTFFSRISYIVWSQLPLFLFLILTSIIPIFFNEIDSRRLYILRPLNIIIQMMLPILLIVVLSAWKKWIGWAIFIITNILLLLELSCYFNQHSRFNSIIAAIILQTNPEEAGEFLSSAIKDILKAGSIMLSIAVATLIFKKFWKPQIAYNRITNFANRLFWTPVLIGIILTSSLIYSPFSLYNCFGKFKYTWQRIGQMTDAAPIITYYYAAKDSFFNPDLTRIDDLAVLSKNLSVSAEEAKDSLTIVYVIGESANRLHSDLYGYKKCTYPKMGEEAQNGNLIIFHNIITHAANTKEVVPDMLSTDDITSQKQFVDYPLLPTILKKGGYKVGYFDNQSIIGNGKNYDFTHSFFFGNPTIRHLSIDYFNDKKSKYDGDFVKMYPPILSNSKNCTIYHLMGQHLVFRDRYPDGFNRFNASDYLNCNYDNTEQQEFAAYYDNATLYNDAVLAHIIEPLRDKLAIMIYAPDHGEEVYDYRDHKGRDINISLPNIRVFYEIPVFIWVSKKFLEQYPNEVSILRENVLKPLFVADLPHTIIDLTGIQTEYFRSDLSLLREGGGRFNRIIKNINYDKQLPNIQKCRMRYEK